MEEKIINKIIGKESYPMYDKIVGNVASTDEIPHKILGKHV